MRRLGTALASAITVALVLGAVRTADARIELRVEEGPPVPRARAQGAALPFSQFPDRQTAAGQRYDLYCPHTAEPNPLVVIAVDTSLPLERAEAIAQHFARTGMIAVAVEPTPELMGYPAAIATVLDHVLAAAPLEAREPGCARSEIVVAWGAGRGGVAVVELAKARAATGRPFAAVVTAFAGTAEEVVAGLPTPILEIDAGAMLRYSTAPLQPLRALIVWGGEACFLARFAEPCLAGSNPARSEAVAAVHDRSRQFFLAFAEGDAAALDAIDRWDAAIGQAPVYPTEDSRETRKLFSLPVLLGGSSEGFVWGVRPELIFTRVRTRGGVEDPQGWGCGLYGELTRSAGRSTFGAGATCVAYLGALGIAPSIGVVQRPKLDDTGAEGALAAGVFIGHRRREGSIDLPFGFRVDTHAVYRGAPERDIIISAHIDTTVAFVLLAGILGFGPVASP